MPDTGNQSTISFAETGFAAAFRELDPGEETLEALEDSDLLTEDQKSYQPSDLAEGGELSGIFWFDQEAALPALGVVEVVTMTLPLKDSANGTNATIVGSGFLTRKRMPPLRNGELMAGEFTFRFDGKATAKTFTPESL